mmetsp:Transcript_32741/g.52476  ORF Transcript_32741/g.52476 Transcript_32741/m.52476 type:complete len:235 (-) Transcript_32741:2421-3125(-)
MHLSLSAVLVLVLVVDTVIVTVTVTIVAYDVAVIVVVAHDDSLVGITCYDMVLEVKHFEIEAVVGEGCDGDHALTHSARLCHGFDTSGVVVQSRVEGGVWEPNLEVPVEQHIADSQYGLDLEEALNEVDELDEVVEVLDAPDERAILDAPNDEPHEMEHQLTARRWKQFHVLVVCKPLRHVSGRVPDARQQEALDLLPQVLHCRGSCLRQGGWARSEKYRVAAASVIDRLPLHG